MQTDLLIFLLTFPSVLEQNSLLKPTIKEISWRALLITAFLDFLIQLSNLPGNLMVYYTVAKIC